MSTTTIYYNCPIVFPYRKSSLPILSFPDPLENWHPFAICYSFGTKANLSHILCTTVNSSVIVFEFLQNSWVIPFGLDNLLLLIFMDLFQKPSTDVTIWKHLKNSVRNSSSQLDHVTPAHTQERADIVPQKRICREGLEPSWCIMQLKDNINLRSVNAKFGKSQRSFPLPTQLLMLTPFIADTIYNLPEDISKLAGKIFARATSYKVWRLNITFSYKQYLVGSHYLWMQLDATDWMQ